MSRLFMCMCFSVLFSCKNQAKSLSHQPPDGYERKLLGRFSFNIPHSFIQTLSEYKVRNVTIKETLWSNVGDTLRSKAFAERLATIEARKKNRLKEGSIEGEIIETRLFQFPKMQGVAFHWFDNPYTVSWGGLLSKESVDTWFEIYGDLDRSEEWAKRLTDMAKAYEVSIDGPQLPDNGQDCFYLTYGLLKLPFRYQESAKVVFENKIQKIKLTVNIHTVNQSKSIGFMEKAAQNILLGEMGYTIKKSGSRKIAGLKGDELIFKVDDELYYTWNYMGEKKSERYPKITIEMQANIGKEEESIRVWDNILTSFQSTQ